MLSVREEFLQSVKSDTSMSLAKRFVWLRRSLSRPSRYGNISIRMQHLDIIRAEILQRLKRD